MTNGDGEIAERLVLSLPDGRDGGGRCRRSVVAVVRACLDRAYERVEH
jgi:hypothetical protein